MKSKTLFSIIFLTFLISSVFAVTIDVDYADFSTSKTITNGQSIDVYVDGGSMNPSTLVTVKLNSNIVYQETFTGNSISKIYTITPLMYSDTVGTYTIEVTATDSLNTDLGEVTLIVTSTNSAPTITSTPIETILEENSYTYQVTASDLEGNPLTYSLLSAPSWLSINSGLISGTAPSVSSNTANQIIVGVSDGTNSISQTYTLTILDSTSIDTTAPVITLIGSNPQIIELGNPYTELGATALDDFNGNLTSSITINSNVNISEVGAYQVVYSVSDLSGNPTAVTRIVIFEDTTAPIITITSPTNKTYTYSKDKKPMDFVFTISDANLQNCWYKLNDEANVSFSCSLNKLENINVKTGQNILTIYAQDSFGNENSTSVTFEYRYKKKSSSSGGAGITTIISPITDIEPTGNIVIPGIQIENKEDYTMLYAFMIATTSLGIIILSIILSRRLKELKKNVSKNQLTKKEEQPYY